jgi:hypothetical protein
MRKGAQRGLTQRPQEHEVQDMESVKLIGRGQEREFFGARKCGVHRGHGGVEKGVKWRHEELN